MIRLILGNVGSGKTATTVRYMKNNPHKIFFTNIDVKGKGMKHVHKLKAEMIIKKIEIGNKRDGTPVYKLKLNVEHWKGLIEKYRSINVVIDEAHIFFNPRRSMSKLNIIMTDFLALLRRVLGSTDGHGELILITQLSRRLDIIAKEMSTHVTYCKHHYRMKCSRCMASWNETNESADIRHTCPRCGNFNIHRVASTIEMYEYRNIERFNIWFSMREKTYYRHYLINDIEDTFGNFETLQFDDLFSDY